MDEKKITSFFKLLEDNNYNTFLVYKFYPEGVIEEMESTEEAVRFLIDYYIHNKQRFDEHNKSKKASNGFSPTKLPNKKT